MATYTVELTKKLMRTITLEVPDDVPSGEVEDWCYDWSDDLWDAGDWPARTKTWEVDDLVEGETITMLVTAKADEGKIKIDRLLRK